ncbi:MAG: protein-glutamate O-methyltransferase CheR [Alphaproteobacteria bacterium]|nr:protein-glutamate O-methyltransferase CheR [Alphaproteobacteria bacterium]MCL2505004.1 protein-glutamate O-methyltransferase CheR [Alphaproteobacteria bacterium]
MKQEDFDLFSTLVYKRSGIVLSKEKTYLLEARLTSVARKYNLASIEELAKVFREMRKEEIAFDITEAMTTNESFFFRDQKPFTILKNVILPYMMNARQSTKRIRIWSAASSGGQEAYSIAIVCQEIAAAGWNFEIIGTDLSREMVIKAKSGIYSQFEVQRGLPVNILVKYFTQVSGDKWQINQNIRNMVSFKEANLLSDSSGMGVFDVVFCRNVLIYFDVKTKTRVLSDIANMTAKDGYLILGGAETVMGISDKFKTAANERGLYVLT